MRAMGEILQAIRRAIEASDKTRYRISQESGVSQSQLSRLMSGESGLSVENIERLADCLGLRITIERKRRRKGR